MKIGIAQINTKLGDVPHNTDKIKQVISDIGTESDVIVFPEMTLPGYPLHDRIYDKNLLKAQRVALDEIQQHIKNTKEELKVILGFIDFDETKTGPDGKRLKWNSAAILDGETMQTYNKQLLPTYDVFYDKRYFQPGEETTHFGLNDGSTAAVTICEDMRHEGYPNNPIQDSVQKTKTDIMFNISSSPYSIDKVGKRLDLIADHVQKTNIPFVYVNQVGGQDGHVYDGHSMIMNTQGEVVYFGKGFEEDVTVVDMDKAIAPLTQKVMERSKDKYRNILEAIKLGTKDFLGKVGIKDVIIGVSGGIDSAISLYILSQILPKERIHAYYLPSKHSKSESYVQELCNNLDIPYQSIDISDTMNASIADIEKTTGEKVEGLAYENIQAQIRGLKLMTLSRMHNGVVVNNSNRTEIAQGYATIYGDTIGFMSIIGDLLKPEVYELAKYINIQDGTNTIPESIITRKASAELTDDQVDPFDYDRVSQAIDDLFCGEDADIVREKYNLSEEETKRYLQNIDRNEFKRKQSPTVIKLRSPSVGGGGRLYPIVYGG